RIGTRNAQNFELLKEVGLTNKPVMLKRGLAMTVEEWLQAAEYIAQRGNSEIILCERGIRTFEPSTRNTLDLAGMAAAQAETHLPRQRLIESCGGPLRLFRLSASSFAAASHSAPWSRRGVVKNSSRLVSRSLRLVIARSSGAPGTPGTVCSSGPGFFCEST